MSEPPSGYYAMAAALEEYRNLPEEERFFPNQLQDPINFAIYLWHEETDEYRERIMSDPLLRYEPSLKRRAQLMHYSSFSSAAQPQPASSTSGAGERKS